MVFCISAADLPSPLASLRTGYKQDQYSINKTEVMQ